MHRSLFLRGRLQRIAYHGYIAGGESDLLDQMIPPGTLYAPSYIPGSENWSGAQQLRGYFVTSGNLARGDYTDVATALGTENGILPNVPTGVQGELLRRSGFPENFIWNNPQFDDAYYQGNLNHSNYHSMQAQATLRPTHGLNFQATYAWSRNLGNIGYADPLNRALDYGLTGQHRSHMLTTYGTYNLPLGPNGYLFRDSSGWARKVVEGWQLSWISSLTSGLPMSPSTEYLTIQRRRMLRR